MLVAMNFDGTEVKIEVRKKFVLRQLKASFMGFVMHTLFKGDDKRLSSAFISNQHPAFFLEISFNSSLIRLDQLFTAFTGKIPQKTSF